MAVVLIIKTEDGGIAEVPVLNKIIMGRSSSSDYKISDSILSGTHCSFELDQKGQLLFKDLGSTNGSFLNNSQVQQTTVKINDVIRVGTTTITIDEKRLSPSDKLIIGFSQHKKNKKERDRTLPDLSRSGRNVEIQSETPPKKTLENDVMAGNKKTNHKNEIDPGVSTGDTKFLKLNHSKKKKP